MRLAVLLVQLSLLLLSGFTFCASISPQASPPHYHAVSPVAPPSHPPSHHHHHHHHPHPHPPTPSPTAPPTPSPPKVPVHPPVHPPTKPPVHQPPAPTKPPTKPPTHSPPVNPPTPPTKPPVKPPSPPTKPPVKPPTPPTKPPVLPPTPPTKPPVKPPTPPTKPPVKPPPTPPSKPPSYPPAPPSPSKPPPYPIPQRSLIAVQGVVYCKSCKYAGVDTLLGAKPVPGATVRLTCNNTKNKLTVQLETDKNGYFFLQAPKTITNFGIKSCSVSLVSSPLKSCSKPSNLNGGLKGSPLKPEKPSATKEVPYVLYSVGPFAFEPTCS